MNLKPGDQVRIKSNHWLRPNQIGILREFCSDQLRPWLVEFTDVRPGGGFMDKRFSGQCLQLDEADFEPYHKL